jgi:hypothetical protein
LEGKENVSLEVKEARINYWYQKQYWRTARRDKRI